MGREESVHYLNHPAEIVWKLQTGEERAANIFYPPFLQNAMVNLNMIDSQGFGIHDMFENQRSRFLPMPDYDKSTDKHVIMVMPGQVINEEYSTALMENTSLDLTTVFLLDRVQRNKPISKEARATLRDLNLIEGRHPHIIISRRIAQITHKEAEYTALKGFDDEFCKDLILKSLREHQKLQRGKIDELLIKRLPENMSTEQKKNHIGYLLRILRKDGKIYVGDH